MQVLQEKKTNTGKRLVPAKPTTVAEFERWQARKRTDNNYEFYCGEIIKKEGMKQLEGLMINYLLRCFIQSKGFEEGGLLTSEMEVYIDAFRKRIPNLSYFTRPQLVEAAKGIKVIPAFVIEILSENETLRHVERKVKDYFDAKVELVWYVLPESKRIYAYTSTTQIAIYSPGETIAALSVLADFVIDMDKLFATE